MVNSIRVVIVNSISGVGGGNKFNPREVVIEGRR